MRSNIQLGCDKMHVVRLVACSPVSLHVKRKRKKKRKKERKKGPGHTKDTSEIDGFAACHTCCTRFVYYTLSVPTPGDVGCVVFFRIANAISMASLLNLADPSLTMKADSFFSL